MAKMISISDTLYEELKAMKMGDESFGSTIKRNLDKLQSYEDGEKRQERDSE